MFPPNNLSYRGEYTLYIRKGSVTRVNSSAVALSGKKRSYLYVLALARARFVLLPPPPIMYVRFNQFNVMWCVVM